MTRRSWSLAIVAFGAGAVVASTLLAPSGAAASQGQPVIAGVLNTATNATLVESSQQGGTGIIATGDATGLAAVADADGGTSVYGLQTNPTGIGVEGDVTGSGSGVYGHASGAGVGVNGQSDSGVGVEAQAGTGTALKVDGKASFSRSGVVTIGAGTSSRTVQLAGVTTSSMVLATAQQATTVYVKVAAWSPIDRRANLIKSVTSSVQC